MSQKISEITKTILSVLPSWMKMRKDEDSVGMQFMNVFGLEFEDIEMFLSELFNNQFIGTADLGQIDIIYKDKINLENMESNIELFTPDKKLERVSSLRDFYEKDDVFIYNSEEGFLYTKNYYEDIDLYIDSEYQRSLELDMHHVWNTFDEFALLVGIERLPGEENARFKERILDVFRRPGNATKRGMQYGIGRELDISPEHVELDSLNNNKYIKNLMMSDNRPSKDMKKILDKLSNYTISKWEDVDLDSTYWTLVDEDMIGLKYLPKIWDAGQTGLSPNPVDFHSGIGDGDELKVKHPDNHESVQDFNYYVTVNGIQRDVEQSYYAPVELKYNVCVEGMVPDDIVPPNHYWYTIQAAEIISLDLDLRVFEEYEKEVKVDLQDDIEEMDDTLEIIDADKINSSNNPHLKLGIKMETDDEEKTPKLESVKINYLDTNGNEQSKEIGSSEFHSDLEGDLAVSPSGIVTLPLGAVDLSLGSDESWSQNYEWKRNVKIGGGKLSLKN